jgi:hypothetical protein
MKITKKHFLATTAFVAVSLLSYGLLAKEPKGPERRTTEKISVVLKDEAGGTYHLIFSYTDKQYFTLILKADGGLKINEENKPELQFKSKTQTGYTAIAGFWNKTEKYKQLPNAAATETEFGFHKTNVQFLDDNNHISIIMEEKAGTKKKVTLNIVDEALLKKAAEEVLTYEEGEK